MQDNFSGGRQQTRYGKVYLLMDCNNFFVSCERVFRPDLEGRPVIVLSNNDGCVIARSAEAKRLGIPMGIAAFKVKELIQKERIAVFSSNFPLYLDISRRVMTLLETIVPEAEVYSVDEAFGITHNLTQAEATDRAFKIRNTMAQIIGIPVAVGIAATKTLAKLANHHAKSNPECSGVFSALEEGPRQMLLKENPIGEIWGIGRRLDERLSAEGYVTAWDLATADENALAKRYSVVLKRTVMELKNVDCVGSVRERENPGQIMWSRTFKQRLTAIEDLEEALCNYAAEAAFKLRQHGLYCKRQTVQISTSLYDDSSLRYSGCTSMDFAVPTNDTRDFMKAAGLMLKKLFEPGRRYMRAGVILSELTPSRTFQHSLFHEVDEEQLNKSEKVMRTMDYLNREHHHTAYFAVQKNFAEDKQFKNPEHLSPKYTTDWEELPVLR